MKLSNYHPRLLYLGKLSFKIDSNERMFHEKHKMRQFHQPIQSQEPVTILITSNVNELNKREITKKNPPLSRL